MPKIIPYLTSAKYRAEHAHHRAFHKAGGNELLYRFELPRSPMIVDAGAYVGETAGEYVKRFGGTVHAFEPVPEYAERIAAKGLPNVIVHTYGLGGRDEQVPFAIDGVASSAYLPGGTLLEVRDIVGALSQLRIGHVDLLKLNVEGAEYDIIDRLIDTAAIKHIDHIVVQFHRTVPDHERRLATATSRLSETHERRWSYPWRWDGWSIRQP